MDLPSYRPPAISELRFSEGTEKALRQDVSLGRKLASIAKELHQVRLDSREFQANTLAYYSDRTTGYKVGTSSVLASAKEVLEDKLAPAGVLLIAAKNVLGPAMTSWEPDTLRVELRDREQLNVPDVNYNKLLAALTLLDLPAFYWDATVFSQTVVSFNHELPDPEILYEASVAQVCWAVYEAEIILMENQLHEPEFDYEPTLYTAGLLHREGLVLAPSLLSFAQDALDAMQPKDAAGPKKDDVKEAWVKLAKSLSKDHSFTESALDVQLAKLSACQLYVHEQADKYKEYLSRISTS